jgi:hypothetical protein
MPKYLFTGSYTAEGARGLLKEGGSGRRAATEKMLKSLGGTLEAYYFAFGAMTSTSSPTCRATRLLPPRPSPSCGHTACDGVLVAVNCLVGQ